MSDFDEETDALKSELRRERSINERAHIKAAIHERLTSITLPQFLGVVALFVIPAALIDLGLL